MRKVGIVGGTFDPIHIGHMMLGEAALMEFSLDEVLYIPAGIPPHKEIGDGRATTAQRLRMCELATEDNPHFTVSMIEIEREGRSYTYETLEALKEADPETDYFFIMGGDSIAYFDQWRYPERIVACASLIVAPREDLAKDKLLYEIDRIKAMYPANILVLDTPLVHISSTELRERVASGKSIRYLVPEPVRIYIENEGLYGN